MRPENQSTTNYELKDGQVWKPHRPAWNDPYLNFQLIRNKRKLEIRDPRSETGEAKDLPLKIGVLVDEVESRRRDGKSESGRGLPHSMTLREGLGGVVSLHRNVPQARY